MKILRKIKHIPSISLETLSLVKCSFLFSLFYFLIFTSPAWGLQEGDCLNSNTVVVTGTVSYSTGIKPTSLKV